MSRPKGYKCKKPYKIKTIEERFWTRVDKEGSLHGTSNNCESVCWIWTGYIDAKGYGMIRVANKTERTHTISWKLHFGEIPKGEGHHGMCVLHRCDNPSCVNPSHLFLGSNKDNILDMIKKGRRPTRCNKLTEGQVLEIRNRYKTENITQEKLGAEYKVSGEMVHCIVTKKSWRNL